MNHAKVMFAAMFLLPAICISVALPQEKKIKKSDLPPAVRKAADEQSKGATVKGYSSEVEDGKTQYEVELTVNGRSKDVTIAGDGTVLEVEEQVGLDSLPLEVREGLQKEAGAGKITKVESIRKRDALVAYEGHVVTAGKRREIQVGPDGKALAHSE